MAIPNNNPLEIAASEPKTFDAIWLTDVRILAPSFNQGSIRIKYVPFDSTTGEIAHRDYTRIIQTGDFWLAAQEVPKIKTAMDAVMDAMLDFEAWLEVRNKPTEEI